MTCRSPLDGLESIKFPDDELELEDEELELDEEELELLEDELLLDELLLDELLEPEGSGCPPQLAKTNAIATVAHLMPVREPRIELKSLFICLPELIK